MKSIKTRIISLILCLAFTLTVWPLATFAESIENIEEVADILYNFFKTEFQSETDEISKNFIEDYGEIVVNDSSSYSPASNEIGAVVISDDAVVYDYNGNGAHGIDASSICGETIWLAQYIEYANGEVLYRYYLDDKSHEFYSDSLTYSFIHESDITLVSDPEEPDDSADDTKCTVCGKEPCTCTEVTVCEICNQNPCVCDAEDNNEADEGDSETTLPEPTKTLDFISADWIADDESCEEGTTDTIKRTPVVLYKSLDNGADGIELEVEIGTEIELITKYTFTNDDTTFVFYRYDYNGENEQLAEAALSEQSGYQFIYSEYLTEEELIYIETEDPETGVSISAELPSDVVLEVTTKSLEDTGIDTSIYPIGEASLFYDVTLNQNGAEYQPENGITVTFPEDAILDSGLEVGDYYKVYHIHDSVTDVTGPFQYNGGNIDATFESLSIVGVASTENIDLTDVYGAYQSSESYSGYAVINTDSSIRVYGAVNSDDASYIDYTGAKGVKLELTLKAIYETGNLYQYYYLGDDSAMTNSYFIPEEYLTFTCCYNCTGASGCTCSCENCTCGEDGTEILEVIFWELMETVSKEGYNEVLSQYSEELSKYSFTTEQQEVLDYHFSLIPYRSDMVYVPWSGRIGPLMPPVYVPIVSTFSLMSTNDTMLLSTDTGDRVDASGLETSKTVTDNGDGTYNVSLEVYTTGNVTVTTTKTAVDVVLVLDYSQSMTEKFGSTTRFAALKTAINTFVDAIIDEANGADNQYGTDDDIDHRVAVVTYKSNATVVHGLKNISTQSGATTINSWAEGMTRGNGSGTHSDLGLEEAKNVFDGNGVTNDSYTTETRQRVVVFFTDGYPTTSGSSNFDGEFARDAINHAKDLKANYGATVYSVAILDGADPDGSLSWSGTTGNNVAIGLVNGYLHAVSSNYPDAKAAFSGNTLTISNTSTGSNQDYYLTAEDEDDLNDIFDTVANTVIAGGSSIDLGSTTQIKDIVTPYFVMPDNTSDITVQQIPYRGSGSWGTAESLDASKIVTIDSTERSVSVTGFDFNHNYVAENARNENDEDSTENRTFYGRKLRITFIITIDPDFLGGSDVETNGTRSGVFDAEGNLVEEFNYPDVDIDLKEISNIVKDKHIYLSNRTDLTGILDLYVKITEGEGTTNNLKVVVDGVNNAYVNLVYTIELDDNTIATYTIPAGKTWAEGTWDSTSDTALLRSYLATNDTEFSVSCTMSDAGEVLASTSTTGTAKIYVYKPTVTFEDSVQEYNEPLNSGATYTDANAFLGTHFVSTVWKHGETLSTNVTMEGEEPEIEFSYSYEGSPFAEMKMMSVVDVPVNVTATIKGTSSDSIGNNEGVTYEHLHCEPECNFNAATEEFIVHVINAITSLTIKKDGLDYKTHKATDTYSDYESAIIKVSGKAGTFYVVLNAGNDYTATISGLIIGDTYTITEETSWTWRYETVSYKVNGIDSSSNTNCSVTLIADYDAGTEVDKDNLIKNYVVITNSGHNDKWLGGDNYAVNVFGSVSGN